MDEQSFEKVCGVGVDVSDEEIRRSVATVIAAHRNDLLEQRYSYPISRLLFSIKSGRMKWADGRKVKEELDNQILALLGSRSEADQELASRSKRQKTVHDDVPEGFVSA